ncbi:MAG: hypothetical protein RL367_2016 [Pseudomonadota bacterium]
MFSTKKTAALSAALLALVGTSDVLANPMVVRSTGPSAKAFPTGKALPGDAKLALKAGDLITVLDSGGTRVLKGPGMIAVSGSTAASGMGFGQLIANTGARQARTGATRSAIGGGPARSPNVWYVDASKSGSMCVADPASLSVWRPDNSAAASLAVTRISDGKAITLDFRAGQSVRAWPAADLPVTQGGQYKIAGADAKSAATVKVVLLGSTPEGLEAVATNLLQKGCTNQMDVVVDGTMQQTQVAVATP